jgi:hypothetical protein
MSYIKNPSASWRCFDIAICDVKKVGAGVVLSHSICQARRTVTELLFQTAKGGASVMKKLLKVVLLGFLTWLVPFVVSCFFYSRDGVPLFDIFFIKTIMIVVFSFLGALLLVWYFKKITDNYLTEGIVVGLVWLAINWILDFVVLIPLAKMSVAAYFTQIGLRYLMIPTMSIAMGYLIENKLKTE